MSGDPKSEPKHGTRVNHLADGRGNVGGGMELRCDGNIGIW